MLNYYKLAELSPQCYAIEQGELKVKGSDNVAWSSAPEYGTLAAGTYTVTGNNVEIRDASKNTEIATCIGGASSKFTLNEDTAIKIKVGYGLDKYPIVAKTMLNKGDSKKPYEPYTGGKPSPSPEYLQEITTKEFKDIKIHGKNLLGGKYYYVSYSSGIGIIEEDTSNLEPIFPYTPATEDKGVGKIMHCKKGITYTLSVTDANSNYAISIVEYANVEDAKNRNNFIGRSMNNSSSKVSYTASSNGILLCYIAGKWTDGTTIHTCTDTELLQVEIGETATAYEPYTEQTFSFSEPVVLSGLKVEENGNYTDENGQQWVTDEIDLARGKYVQRIQKHIFNGSEKFEFNDTTDAKFNRFSWSDYKDLAKVETPVLCENYEFTGFTQLDSGRDTEYCYGSRGYARCFFMAKKDVKTIESFLEIIRGKTVYYVLKTPIETDLPPETIAAFKKLHINYPTTIITNNADAGMELTYTVDTQSYIDSKIAEISTAIVQKGI